MSTANRSVGGVEAAQVSLVFVTVPTKEVAHRIAHNLVESKLAACVNIIPGTQPCMVWNRRTECLLFPCSLDPLACPVCCSAPADPNKCAVCAEGLLLY
jgi:periplasmic divalent cation tolerance protein